MGRLLLLFLWALPLFARPTVCLNMIVKNESHVIERCLNSVKGVIDTWVIVDTGSTDGTQALIEQCLKGIPGELHERPWVNFGHNRGEALHLAKGKGDYLLLIDADEELVFEGEVKFPPLIEDSYLATVRLTASRSDYRRLLLIKSSLDWKWVGAVHEELLSKEAGPLGYLPEVVNLSHQSGARSRDPETYLKDARLLEEALEKDPENPRNVFYLAQSYACAAEYEKAFGCYIKRAQMGGWEEEVYQSLYCAAKLQALLIQPPETFLHTFAEAYTFRPTRAEPLYQIASHYIEKENYLMGYLVSKQAIQLPLSSDTVYVEPWIYEWGALLQFVQCAAAISEREEALGAIEQLFKVPTLPDEILLNLIQVKMDLTP